MKQSFKTMDKYDEDEVYLIIMYAKMGMGLESQENIFRLACSLGYEIPGYQCGKDDGKMGLPDLSSYIGKIVTDFTEYLKTALPQLGEHMRPDRVDGIVEMVEELLYSSPPDMEGLLGLAKEAGLTEEEGKTFMTEIKNYLNGLIGDILRDATDIDPEALEASRSALEYALETMSPQEYLMTMGHVFSGEADMEAVMEFVNMEYEMPDTEAIQFNIVQEIRLYLATNMPLIGLEYDEELKEYRGEP